jgi:alcohol dehydrogenase class IV
MGTTWGTLTETTIFWIIEETETEVSSMMAEGAAELPLVP